MKDITHYFSDTIKSCEISSTDSTSNVKLRDSSRYICTKKRARVKIKISRINSKSRVCNIVENKNDLIDKTPSPFTKVSKETKGATHCETPKKSIEVVTPSSSEENGQQVLKEVDLNHVLIELDSEPEMLEEDINKEHFFRKSLDKRNSNESKMEYDLKNNTKFNNNAHSSNKINKEITEIDVYEVVSKDKKSNAFHVLMNRDKTINYVSSVHSLLENDILSESVKSESKEKLKQSKEKLAFGDKRNNSKRKLKEIEEGDKIEEVLKKRMKPLRRNVQTDNSNSTIINVQRNTVNNSLQFTSKRPIELEQEETINVSTIVVKADVHMSDVPTVDSLIRTVTPASDFKNKITNIPQTKFLNIDNMNLITSEDIIEEPVINENLQSLQQHNKHKWSLRIKLQSPKGDSSKQTIFSPKSKINGNVEQRRKYEQLHSNTEKKNINECTKLYLQKQKKVNGQEDKSNKKSFLFNSIVQKDIINEEEIKQLTDDIIHVDEFGNCNKFDITIKNRSEHSSVAYNYISEEKSHIKLAPLFIKQLKPNAAPAAIRRSGLQSDIINNENKNMDKKIIDYNMAYLPFPKISHITQLNNEIQTNNKLNMYHIQMKSEIKYVPKLIYHNNKYTSQSIKAPDNSLINVNASVEKNMEEVLTEMEKCCADTRKMWKTVVSTAKCQSSVAQSLKTNSKKRKSSRKEEIEKNEENKIENSVWTNKYKPISSYQIVGNEEAALQLKDWLIKWKSSLNKEDSSSGDEFYSSDCSYTSKNENNQVAVLVGPYGSGKTASVYAVAEELGYSVLEVNASSKRTGKRILKEFEEATKSHRIKKKRIKLLPKPILKEMKDLPQNSLILLEDIDLIFEEDEGFISATCQLASNTKRPIVMTCRNVCSHLNKMAPEQNRIYFQKVIGNRVSTLLELISLAETGFRLSFECLAELLQNGDLRKALLQLQYLLVSGSTHTVKHPFNLRSIIWQDMRNYLYKPAIKENKKQKTKNRLNNKNIVDTNITDILTNLAANLDNLSLLPSLIEINDPALDLTCAKVEPSLSLTEDTTLYSFSKNISLEIAEWIDQTVIYKGHLIGKDRIQYQTTLGLKKQLNKGVNVALSQITSSTSDNRAVSLDYLPSIRTICRAEECRATSQSKRGNRFFHYLNGLKLPVLSIQSNILTVACKALQEKSPNTTS